MDDKTGRAEGKTVLDNSRSEELIKQDITSQMRRESKKGYPLIKRLKHE